ncbi:hypothetical protein ADS77_11205 [Pseudoalteromonas porphyrae]|uniref:DAGKc domain-containing protein n=2 Tax=Pseudoalteromonas TaxID=53246 RepID=A0A0N1MU78_9GAMM|nr:hypothetical protein ADS77_11205 [Pseudoalteromonas porphyrae]
MTMLIIIKPSTNKNHKKVCDWLLHECNQRQISTEIIYTTGNFHPDCKKITQRAEYYQRAVVVGGDGTLNLAVNALVGLSCSLALLPLGTGNDFSRGFGCSDKEWRTAVFSQGDVKIDVGQINDRYFVNIAGVGFDAHVVKALQTKPARSSLGYSLAGFKYLLGYKGTHITSDFSGREYAYKNLITVFANHRYFGGGLAIAPKARLNSGYLECYAMPARGLLGNLYSFMRLLLRNHHTMTGLEYQRVTVATINTPNLPIEADGELIGVTPASIQVHPRALRFCVPTCTSIQLEIKKVCS